MEIGIRPQPDTVLIVLIIIINYEIDTNKLIDYLYYLVPVVKECIDYFMEVLLFLSQLLTSFIASAERLPTQATGSHVHTASFVNK